VTLAYGVIRPNEGEPRVCARVGGSVVDLSELGPEFCRPSLNDFMALGPDGWRDVHARVRQLEGPTVKGELLLPFAVADYVDFYSSLEHATNLGRMFRPDTEPLLPNWRWLPVAYHGRAGTVVPSGTPIRRPHGQRKPPGADEPDFGPSARLDIELEIGFVVGTPSRLGEPVQMDDALAHVFGLVLVNDWSARDVQAWEYQPLGPFLGKSFATSISAWVVPLEELEPFRVPLPPQQPPPLDYLRAEPWAYDLALEIELNGTVVSRTSARHLYWSLEQQVAHLTVNGACLRTGDLLASGTISGPEPESRGSLIELTWNGTEPLRLSDDSTRNFLEDGDEVVLRAPQLELEVRGRIE
jgi:fumarylacetoacetase